MIWSWIHHAPGWLFFVFKTIIAKAKGAARDLLVDVIAKIAVETAKGRLGM